MQGAGQLLFDLIFSKKSGDSKKIKEMTSEIVKELITKTVILLSLSSIYLYEIEFI